jgi:hypothetical protein
MTRIGRHPKEWAAEHHGQDKLVAVLASNSRPFNLSCRPSSNHFVVHTEHTLETPKSAVYQLPIHAIRRLLGGTFGRLVAWTDAL